MKKEKFVGMHIESASGIIFFRDNSIRLYVVDEKSWQRNGHKYDNKFDVLLSHLPKCGCYQKIVADVSNVLNNGRIKVIVVGKKYRYEFFDSVLTLVYVT